MNDKTKKSNLKTVPAEVEMANVIDIATKQSLLPSQIRKALIAQYAESVALEEKPVQFAMNLEKRLLTEMTYAGAQIIKGFFEGDN